MYRGFLFDVILAESLAWHSSAFVAQAAEVKKVAADADKNWARDAARLELDDEDPLQAKAKEDRERMYEARAKRPSNREVDTGSSCNGI